MMIVSLTRDDLRDEFAMANEAFALSPISARATQPSEEDYDAISEAFMETSRAAGFSANTPSATATPTPGWCSTR